MLESLIALGILAIGLGAVFLVFERSQRWTEEARAAAAAGARIRTEVEALTGSGAPRPGGGPGLWTPGERVESPIPLVTATGSPASVQATLRTTVADIERAHEGRTLRLRSARLDLEYRLRGRLHTVRREVLRAVEP